MNEAPDRQAPSGLWVATKIKRERSECDGCGKTMWRGWAAWWSPKFKTMVCDRCHRRIVRDEQKKARA